MRLGTVFAPNGDDDEAEGTINPAAARLRDGALAFYPRVVARGNVSRVRRCRSLWNGDDVRFERDAFALEPHADFEFRTQPGGYGCEDPRVTYVAALDLYLMAYCAYGPAGAQVAVRIHGTAGSGTGSGRFHFVVHRTSTVIKTLRIFRTSYSHRAAKRRLHCCTGPRFM